MRMNTGRELGPIVVVKNVPSEGGLDLLQMMDASRSSNIQMRSGAVGCIIHIPYGSPMQA